MSSIPALSSFPPALYMVGAAVLVLLLPSWTRRWIALAAPAWTLFALIWIHDPGDTLTVRWLSFELNPLRVDMLSLSFGYIFTAMAAIGAIYGWHLRDEKQQTAWLFYGGATLGAVFAGDLFTLILCWELMALGSTYLVMAGGYKESVRAGFRYLFVHVVGGAFLLGGVLWHLGTGGGLEFTAFGGGPASWLVLIGFLVNAAVPPLHAWLTDAYPESGLTGILFLNAFTSKTAVYALARGFEGWDILVPLGVIGALYGLVYAVLENDMRRLLAYHAVSQLGFMVAAVGVGGQMGINGAVAFAVTNILYKNLMFMGTGAVIFATGRRKMSDLGGIYHKMRPVFFLYMVGGLSISAFPFTAGFPSKSLVIHAAEEAAHSAGQYFEWAALLLLVASVGTFLHTGLKLPYSTWLGKRRDDIPVGRIPVNMYVAMGITAFLCIWIGFVPRLLFDRLPFPELYNPYTIAHVVHTVEFLAFTGLGFWLFLDKLHPERTIALDTDWFYRKAGKPAYVLVQRPLELAFTAAERATNAVVAYVSGVAADPARAVGGLVSLWRRGREASPEQVQQWLVRPPLGVAVGFVLLVFGVVVLIANGRG